MASNQRTDYIIIGAGIVGLCLAYEIKKQEPRSKIVIIEKEKKLGLHGSGRNSGVLHSGVYYPKGSWKSKVCANGAKAMAAYCEENDLPINHVGKVIIPTKEGDETSLMMLYERAMQNGAEAQLIDEKELSNIEPFAFSATGKAIFLPNTAVVEPISILQHLYQELIRHKVKFYFNCFCSNVDIKNKSVKIKEEVIYYGHLYNTAGLYADKVARACGLEKQYGILPFKGMYYQLSPNSKIKINHLIYPVPDLNMPFLGVHFTKAISGTIYLGPNAIPALGRENYHGLSGLNLTESIKNIKSLTYQYIINNQNFRQYVHQETPRFLKTYFVQAVKKLVPAIESCDIVASSKVGIRAQLYDYKKKELVTDFVIKKMKNETHVLNAISPAFTCAFSLAKNII